MPTHNSQQLCINILYITQYIYIGIWVLLTDYLNINISYHRGSTYIYRYIKCIDTYFLYLSYGNSNLFNTNYYKRINKSLIWCYALFSDNHFQTGVNIGTNIVIQRQHLFFHCCNNLILHQLVQHLTIFQPTDKHEVVLPILILLIFEIKTNNRDIRYNISYRMRPNV